MTTHSEHHLPVRVYWEDTDAGGIVYHASYLRFMERGRTEWLRETGIDQQRLMDETGTGFVVRHMSVDFLAPARLDDMLDVMTGVIEFRGASMLLHQRVMRAGTLLVGARVTVASVRNGRPSRLPAFLKEHFAPAGE